MQPLFPFLPARTISVENSTRDDHVITREKYLNVFTAQKGKNEKTFPGFGIGLFIAGEIIKRHEGNIRVTSEPGKDSVSYFSIPFSK